MSGGAFLLDTNIVINACARRGRTAWDAAVRSFGLGGPAAMFICVVTEAEFRSFAAQNNWGAARLLDLEAVLGSCRRLDIDNPDIIQAYVEIDVFSKARPKGAVNMGKNDIWIAAAAKAAGLPLITTEQDFDHLHGTHLTRHRIDPHTGAVAS